MTPASVLIVDDEPLARRRLARLLTAIDGFQAVGEAGDAVEARALVETLNPDIILLDIQMPGGTGFSVLEQLGSAAPAAVFVTAFDHHALEAFNASAVDYVTKPVDPARLRVALDRARTAAEARRSEDRVGELQETVATLRQALRRHESRPVDFWVKSKGEFVRVPADRVVRLEAERDYVRIHADGRSYLHHESLASLERRLDPAVFVRIHRSAIVRRDGIVKLRQAPFGALIAVLADGSEVRVGRTYSKRMRPGPAGG